MRNERAGSGLVACQLAKGIEGEGEGVGLCGGVEVDDTEKHGDRRVKKIGPLGLRRLPPPLSHLG